MINDELIPAVRNLFDQGRIDYFLGYVRDEGHTFPAILPPDADLSRLTLDRRSYANLANFLPELRGARVGLVCKQCDVRALNVLAAENQIDRSQLVVVGVGCPTMVDPRVAPDEGDVGLDDPALWQEKCRRCAERNTPDADVFVGDKVPTPTPVTGWPALQELDALSYAERERWWRRYMEICIRCYACRLSCPLCYCHQCFVEDNKPQWLDKTPSPENNLHYHIIRAVHLAGRCIGCQECQRACPVGIPVDLFNQVLTRDFAARFDFHAGASPETKAALIDFQREDKEDFIL